MKNAIKERWRLAVPAEKVKNPIIHEIGHKFSIVTNIEKAEVKEDGSGTMILEILGDRHDIHKTENFLFSNGITITVISSSLLLD